MTVAAPVQDAPAEGGRHHDKYDRLVAAAQSLPKLKVAVAHPCDAASMSAVFEAAALGLIDPILVGPRAKIAAAADAIKKDPSPFRIVDAPHSHAAAEKAVEIVRLGEAEALMKGSLHTDELMAAVVSREGGLRTARRISHCFVMDVPGHENALVITDAAINIAPSLEDKVHIVQNAIDLVRALGIEPVRVAILSAMETVNPKVPSTLEAAALCKMADRGQITGGIRRRAACPRQRHRSRSGEDQENRIAGRRPRERSRRPRPRGRQHARKEPHLSRRCRRRRNRARCAGAHHPHEPRGLDGHAACLLRRRLPGCRRPAQAARRCGGVSDDARFHRAERGIVQPQIPGLRGARGRRPERRLQGALRGTSRTPPASSRKVPTAPSWTKSPGKPAKGSGMRKRSCTSSRGSAGTAKGANS